MSGSVLISFCLNNCSTISTATSCYILHESHSKLWHIQNYVYSGTCRNIQAFLALLRHIQDYSGIFSTLCNGHILTTAPYSEPWHIYKQSHSKPCETFDKAYWETYHSQNSLFKHYSAISRTLCIYCTWINLAYLESCNIQNPSAIAFRGKFRTLSYLRK